MHYIDVHTHNTPRLGIPSIVDVSGVGDCCFEYEYFTAGIHPKSIGEDYPRQLSEIENFAAKKGFVGVGECGLDKFSDSPRDLQENVFEAQLSLAQRLRVPIIIHCVRLYTDALRLIKKVGLDRPAIFHGYNGNPAVTAQLLKLPNIYFSFSEQTFALPETSGAKSLPLIPPQRILTESDCNSATDLGVVVQKIADIKQLDPASLQEIIYENFIRIVSSVQCGNSSNCP